jgi:hypothetical protein
MTRWVMWLLAWLAVIGLPWSLGLHAGDISQVLSPVSLSSRTVLRTFGVILSTRPPSIHTRETRDLSALPRPCLLVGDDRPRDRPPWLDTRGPPAPGASPWVLGTAAGQAGSSKARLRACFQRKFTAWAGPTKKIGFCNSL